ncbi:MAG: efflux transporter outer membrane subunit [Sphingomicrobium sp.]
MFGRILLLSPAALLAACAAGPTYVPPHASPTAAAAFVHGQSAAFTLDAPADANWWRLYGDPVLDGLVHDALAANTDVRVAVARLQKSRAILREEAGAREPQVGLGASGQYGRVAGLPAGGEGRDALHVGAGVDVAYEVDLFGRLSGRVEAARGELGASAADVAAVQVAVVADTMRAYADAASSAERIAVAERIVALLDRSLTLTQKRQSVGLANGLDVARMGTLRDQRRAEIPVLVAQREAALLRLATLTGRTRRELPASIGARTHSLALKQPIPIGDGAALLARRPDVRAAERRLAASTARIGVATADLYPRITLGGTAATASAGVGNVLSGNALTLLLGPLLNWTVNRNAARARVAGAKADTQAALAAFDGTVLQALEETEAALSNYQQILLRRQALLAARDQAERAATITRARQREGDISSLELLDAERTAADTQGALAEADAQLSASQIQLFRALGGGWVS